MNKRNYFGCLCFGFLLCVIGWLVGCRQPAAGNKNVVKQEFLDGEVMISKGEDVSPADFTGNLGSRPLEEGFKGEDVKALQEKLRLAGFVNYQFNPGVFDSWTKKAVLEYQKGQTPYLKEILKFSPEDRLEPNGRVDLNFCRQLIRKTGYYAKLFSYQINSGENLSFISNKFKIPLKELVILNNINTKNHFIRAGETIFIILHPDRLQEKIYQLPAGENLQQIAEKFKVPLEDLIRANCLFKGSLKAGESLYIPARLEAAE